MKLRKKYFTIFFILFFLMAFALSLTSYILSNNILLKKYKELSIEKLSYINDITETELTQLTKSFVFISNNSLVIDRIQTDYSVIKDYNKLYDDRRVNDMLSALNSFEIFNAVNLIYIIGNNGERYWYKVSKEFFNEKKVLTDIKSNYITNGSLYYMGIGYSSNNIQKEQQVLKFMKVLKNINEKKIGTIYLELNLDYFSSILLNEKMISGTSIYLIDNFNNLIYHPDKEKLGSKFVNANKSEVRVTSNLLKYDWRIISESPMKNVIRESSTIFKATMIMAIISIILSIIIIGFITGKIVKPIQNLIYAMNKVKDGNMDLKVNYTGNDEISELTEIFNKMTAKLKINLDNNISHAKSLNDAEYKALQAQINPHFMYNSLNSLRWMANMQNAHNITEIIDALWTLLKLTSSLKGQFICLKDELRVIDAYSTIQQVRYKGKFTISYNIEQNHKDIIIPKFILQPFIENSIFHGIEPKKGMGEILISTQIVEDNLQIVVSDDGIGIDKEKIDIILKKDNNNRHHEGFNSIGIKNVDDRLKLLYGNKYGIIIESKLNDGTKIIIKIPINSIMNGETLC